MKRILKYFLVAIFAQATITVSAQKSQVKKAIKKSEKNYAYVETSEILLKVAEDGYKNEEVISTLADSYYFNNDMKEASRWYGELFKLYPSVDAEYYFRYALALKGVKKYKESDKWINEFIQLNPNDSRSKSFKNREDYLSEINNMSNGIVDVTNLDINSENSDFGTVFDGENLIFASSRANEDNDSDDNYSWNNQPYLELYSAFQYSEGDFAEPKLLNKNINTKFHESSAAYMADGKTMFFTRNNFYKRRKRRDNKGVNRLKLFRATLDENGVWGDVTPIHFNSDDYSVAHPTINAEQNRLYFTSDMPESIGNSDIWVVDINDDGTLGTPRNLGASINTEGQDSFPFINEKGDLFFSTVGLPGLGGYDIFVARDLDSKIAANSTGRFEVQNIGEPYNSNADDFAYFELQDGDSGYFTSNRDGGKGDDDIYSFKANNCSQAVSGVVRDSKTNVLLPGANVVLSDGQGNIIEEVIVGDDASFNFQLDCQNQYLVKGTKENYSTVEERIQSNQGGQDLELVLGLLPNKVALKPCDDLAKSLNIPLIYFELDEYKIEYVSEIELQKILAVLYKYPTMTIDIRSHTDCRASDDYNQTLSDNRARATRQYLIERGINGNRLTAKGYGETQLVNDCGCSTDRTDSCSELEHQKNRRSEFIITSIKGDTCND